MIEANNDFKPKSFWQKPEGTTGKIFLGAMILGGGYLLIQALPILLSAALTTLQLALILAALAAVVYMVLDPKMRNLVSYIYKSIMRFITGLFVQIDPIGILESYVDDLKKNLGKMGQQIASLRGQMRKLKDIITANQQSISTNIAMASKAKEMEKKEMMILKSRKAGRLQESNLKLEDLYKKMEILYRILTKMYENSEILMEDIKDQVDVKKKEREAIRTSHSAMKGALDILSGSSSKKEMFDQAMEAIADDVSMKVGEMERFMDMSHNFMESIDLQNGVFEEEGLKMLEKWENEGVSLLLGSDKDMLVNETKQSTTSIDLDAPLPKAQRTGNQYSDLFNF